MNECYAMEACMLSEGRADLVAPLDVDRFIEELSEALPKVAAKGVILRLRATGRDLHAAADREQMRQVFESLVMYGGDVIEGRGTLTIAGRLLPIETDGRYDGNGCLLLSLRCTAAGQGEALFPSEGRGAAAMGRPRLTFSAIRRVIERHHGFFRIFIRRGETDFNVYLPLLRSPFLRAPRAPRSDEQRDYQLFGL